MKNAFKTEQHPMDDHFHQNNEMFIKIFDTLPEQIAVIDPQGKIVYVNQYWQQFANDNGYAGVRHTKLNYLEICRASAEAGDDYAQLAQQGILNVMHQKVDVFDMVYPCHSPTAQRWFTMVVTQLHSQDKPYTLITHQHMCKLATLAQKDNLVDIANQRTFDHFFNLQWQDCMLNNLPLSLALVDIDGFRAINDHYGYTTGDACLQAVSLTLKKHCSRPRDLAARFRRDKFAIVWGDTSITEAVTLANLIVDAVNNTLIQKERSAQSIQISVSIGLTSVKPNHRNAAGDLLKLADDLLQTAKYEGKNKVVFQLGNRFSDKPD